MNYSAQLDTGEKLTLGNDNGHTQIALSSDEEGHRQNQSTAFPTGTWSQKPQLFGVGIGSVIQLETGAGQKWVSIDQNGIHSLDKQPDLGGAKNLDLAESEAPVTEPMKPMAEMKPMAPMKPMGS